MAAAHANPGWTPDIARMMIDEMRKTHEIQRELLHVLRDVRDELARHREERSKWKARRTAPKKATP